MNIAKTISLPAAADYSTEATYKYHFFKINSSRKAEVCSSTVDIPLGVLQNSPVTDDPAEIAIIGAGNISKIYLSGTIATGALVCTKADGEAQADAATNYNCGVLIRGGDDNELGEILLANITVKA